MGAKGGLDDGLKAKEPEERESRIISQRMAEMAT